MLKLLHLRAPSYRQKPSNNSQQSPPFRERKAKLIWKLTTLFIHQRRNASHIVLNHAFNAILVMLVRDRELMLNSTLVKKKLHVAGIENLFSIRA